jgi:hypothetical protein
MFFTIRICLHTRHWGISASNFLHFLALYYVNSDLIILAIYCALILNSALFTLRCARVKGMWFIRKKSFFQIQSLDTTALNKFDFLIWFINWLHHSSLTFMISLVISGTDTLLSAVSKIKKIFRTPFIIRKP